MRKLLLITICLLSLISTGWTEDFAFDEKTTKMCQEIMKSIYYEIYDLRNNHEGLSEFGEKALFENQYEIHAIVYKNKSKQPKQGDALLLRSSYNFGITITKIDDIPFPDNNRVFQNEFPMLGIKLSAYQIWRSISQYDIRPLIKKYSDLLAAHQQTYLDLRLYLRSEKNVYSVNEDIAFEVVLENSSIKNLGIKSLGAKTLFFLYDNQSWGTKPSSYEGGGNNMVLKAGDSYSMRFIGEGFKSPRELEIYGVYRMMVKGVNPYGILKLKIVEE